MVGFLVLFNKYSAMLLLYEKKEDAMEERARSPTNYLLSYEDRSSWL